MHLLEIWNHQTRFEPPTLKAMAKDTDPDINKRTGDKVDDTTILDANIKRIKLSKGPPWYRSQRYILAYILFGGVMSLFVQRTNFSVAIVCMVNDTALRTTTTTTTINNSRNNNLNWYQLHAKSLPKHLKPLGDTVSKLNTVTNNTFTTFKSNNDTYRKQNYNNRNYTTNENDMSDFTERVKLKDENREDAFEYAGACSDILPDEVTEDGPLVWDKKTQGILLGAVYWTYMAFSFPSIFLVRIFSRKRISVVSLAIMSATSMILHGAALWSPWAVFVIKLVQGACTAVAVLSMYGMWTKWAPPEERTGLVAFCFSGSMMANAVVFPLSGLLCKYGFLGGWPSVFYVFGVSGFVMVLVLIFFTTESPALHPRITQEERNYIESSLSHSNHTTPPAVPWKSLLTSSAVWAVVCAHFAFHWGLFQLLSNLPQYMKEVLRFKIDSNGGFSMLPYLAMWFLTLVAGQLSNCVIRRKTISLIRLRKLNTFIANIVPAISLVILSFLDCEHSGLAVFLLASAIGFTGFNFSGFFLIPFDIAPMYAQAIMTFSTTVSMIPGIVTPYIAAAITKDKTREQWQTVFFLTAGVYVLGSVCFCLLAKAELQPWATPPVKEDILIHPPNGREEKSV